MSEWKEYRLGDIGCQVLSGYAFKSIDYSKSGIPLIKIGNLQGTTASISETGDFVSEQLISNKTQKYLLENNDVLIAMTGQGSVGRIGKLKMNPNQRSFLNQRVGKFICDEININKDYLFYILSSEKYQEFLFNAGTGSGQPNLSPELILQVEIPWIEYPQQQAIAGILSSLDDKIDLLHRQNKTLEALAEILFRQWFIEEADESWVPLGEVIKTTSGGTPSREVNDFYINGSINWVKSKELKGNFIFNTEEKITNEALVNSSAKLLPPYTILIAMYGATVGEIGILGNEATCNQAICALIPNENYPYTYLFLYSKYNKEVFVNQSVGSAQQNISQALIKELPVSSNIQKVLNFHINTESLLIKIHTNSKQIHSLTQLRDNLLPKLMSGEVTVGE